jgi:ribonuclease BN (tRNA processing enzyme)
VKIMLVPSSVSEHGEGQLQYLTSYLINDTVAVDAGSLGLAATPAEQTRVQHVLISHTHIDHIGTLPIFVENTYESGTPDSVTIYGSAAVLESLRKDIFNDRVWPDFVSMSTPEDPFLKLEELEADKTIDLDGLRITPIPVNHVVPTFGFLIQDKQTTILIVSDTGPTDLIWERANAARNLKAVFLEASFPNSMAWLADVSKHLTPALFAAEVRKLKKQMAVIAVHIKARNRDEVVKELEELEIPGVEIGRFGKAYTF